MSPLAVIESILSSLGLKRHADRSALLANLRVVARLYAYFGTGHFLVKFVGGLLRRWRMVRVLKHIPHFRVPQHCLLGGIPDMLKNIKRLHHWRDEATRGLPVAKFLGSVWDDEMVYVSARDATVVKYFLKDNFQNFTKSDTNRDWMFFCFEKFLGGGIFVIKHGIGAEDGGEQWSRQRKIATNIFSRQNFNTGMLKTFVGKAKRLRDVLKPGEVVDMQLQFFNYTMDSIMNIFFGEECDTVGGNVNAYGAAFDIAHRCFFEFALVTMPFMSFAKLLPWPFGGFHGLVSRLLRKNSLLYQMFQRNFDTLDIESERIIRKCMADPRLPERTDLLALFMQALQREGVMDEKKSVRYLRDIVLNFIIAGRDTTACTLSWMFFLLATNPDIQKRVIEEVDRCLPNDTEPNLKLVQHANMPLLNALLYETLRLYPPVPYDGKDAQRDDVLPGGLPVPANAKLWFLPWAMGRDPDKWPNPESVVLERWIPFVQPQPHEFPVFQAGPRLCLGMDMAIFEAKVLASMLLQRFSFRLAEGEKSKIHYSNMLTIAVCNSPEQDSHNLWLVPESRS